MAFNLANPTFYGCVLSPKSERLLTFASKPTSRRKQIATTTPKAFAHRGIERPFNYGREQHTVERVLRYPEGYERRIRYPISDEVPSATLTHETATYNLTTDYDYVSQDEDFDPNAWTTHTIWNSSNSSSRDSIDTIGNNATPPTTTTPLEHNKQQHPLPDTSENNKVPLSPLALLRLMTSDAYKIEERRVMQDVASSHTILSNGCPWPVPRPLYILSVVEAQDEDEDGGDNEDAVMKQQQSSSAGQAYTLRVRLPKTKLEDELTRLLGNKTRPDGSSLIRCSELKDGIITFEDEHQAEAFGKLIEDQRSSRSPSITRLVLAKCDSHALFRLAIDVSSVIVLVDKERGVEGLPLPHRLASALRRQDEEDGNW